MKTFTNIEQICETLFQLEENNALLDFEVAGVKIFQLMRMSIYYDIAKATGVLDNPHPGKKRRKSIFSRISSALCDLSFRNPWFMLGKVDAIFFPHFRKVEEADQYIDVYSHFLIDRLEREGKKCCLIEKSKKIEDNKLLARKSKRVDIIRLMNKVCFWNRKRKLSRDDEEALKKIEKLINNAFDVNIKLQKKLKDRLGRFQQDYDGYKRLFRKLQPKQIYVVVAYFGWGEMIKAAKDLDIEVIEIQHGVFSRYHLGYSYPVKKGSTILDFFPGKLMTWGSYWSAMPELPLAKENLLNGGFDYFHIKKMAVSEIKRKNNQILILSQGAIGERFAEQIVNVAGLLADYHLVYKLHPSEYRVWQKNNMLITLAALPNVKIAAQGSDLYSLLAESEYQFGVFSTAIFEGVGMGCKTILFNLPGVEYMQRMVDRGLCILWDGMSDIKHVIALADRIDTQEAEHQLFGWRK